jgi:carotenoid cleavage dioxygenase-like enzyme
MTSTSGQPVMVAAATGEPEINPYLLGVYAPVGEEIDATGLEVIGKIPADLNGVYLRNGPNPRFAPEGRYLWFDGDGMIHAVHLENGKARYRNRWIRTKAFEAESEAGKALWKGRHGKPNIGSVRAGGAVRRRSHPATARPPIPTTAIW